MEAVRNISTSERAERLMQMMRSRKSYLGGEVGFELLKRALKVVRVVMVVVIWSDVVVYVQEMMGDDGFFFVFYTN